MCSRNTVKESSHISFFCGGGSFLRSSATAGEHTQGSWQVCLNDQRISAFSPKLLTYSFFQVPCGYMNILFAHVFFCLWLVIGTYILPFFFSVICWSYLRTEISVTLSYFFYFSFLWKPHSWCYLATALNLLSSSSPAKLVCYKRCTILTVFTDLSQVISKFSSLSYSETQAGSRSKLNIFFLFPLCSPQKTRVMFLFSDFTIISCCIIFLSSFWYHVVPTINLCGSFVFI